MKCVHRLTALERAIAALRGPTDLFEVKNPAGCGAIASRLEAIERAIGDIHAIVYDPPTHVGYRPLREQTASLVVGCEAIALEYGSRYYALDSLRDALSLLGPDQDRGYWSKQSAAPLLGLIREGTSPRRGNVLGAALEQRGVLMWLGDDELVRLVDVHRLKAHRDIFDWVTGMWNGGVRCRSCGMVETPTTAELVDVDIAKRTGLEFRNGMRQLAAGTVNIHSACSPRWHAMVDIAELYSSAAEAAAADVAAGRAAAPAQVDVPAAAATTHPAKAKRGRGQAEASA